MTGRWMTYEEAAERFGLSSEAVRKRSRRLGWEVEPANSPHGKTRIFVPDEVELPPQRPPGRPDEPPPGDRIGHVRTDELAEARSQALLAAVERDAERRRADAAEARIVTMENQVSEARALADRRTEELTEAQGRTIQAEVRLDAARDARGMAEATAARAEARAEAAELELRELRRPLWERMVRAIRG